MPAAAPIGNRVETMTASDTFVSTTVSRNGGVNAQIYALVAYNTDWTTNGITDANFGGAAMSQCGAKLGAAGNISVEVWGTAALGNPASGVVTIHWPVGSIIDAVVFIVEVQWAGIAVAPSGNAVGASGTTSPVTVSITSATYLNGRQATIPVDVTNNLLLAIGCLNRGASGSNLGNPGGGFVAINTATNAGSGALQIQAAAAFMQATGGTDTASWTESVNREWAALVVDISGAAMFGIIRAGGVMPTLF